MSKFDVARAGPSRRPEAAGASAARGEPGAFGAIVGEIITDLVTFAVAHATGRNTAAKAALNEARMRLDELHGRVCPPRPGAK